MLGFFKVFRNFGFFRSVGEYIMAGISGCLAHGLCKFLSFWIVG